MAKVLIVEDEESIRTSLTAALEFEGHVVVAREHGQAIETSTGNGLSDVDLAIVDLGLPGGPDGVELTRILTTSHSIPVVILTAQADISKKGAGYAAGADLYVTKPFSVTELLWQVEALLRRTSGSRELVLVGNLCLDPVQRLVRYHDVVLTLTPTEFDLLAALLRNGGRVVSKPRLLELVWGHAGYDLNLVETAIRRLRSKLAIHAPSLIETVRGSGYRLRS